MRLTIKFNNGERFQYNGVQMVSYAENEIIFGRFIKRKGKVKCNELIFNLDKIRYFSL